MFRIYKLSTFLTTHAVKGFPMSIKPPLVYNLPHYFSSGHTQVSSQSVLSLNSLINNNTIEEASEFVKDIPKGEATIFHRTLEKYKSVKELNLLQEDEKTVILTLFHVMGNKYYFRDHNIYKALDYFTLYSNMLKSGVSKELSRNTLGTS